MTTVPPAGGIYDTECTYKNATGGADDRVNHGAKRQAGWRAGMGAGSTGQAAGGESPVTPSIAHPLDADNKPPLPASPLRCNCSHALCGLLLPPADGRRPSPPDCEWLPAGRAAPRSCRHSACEELGPAAHVRNACPRALPPALHPTQSPGQEQLGHRLGRGRLCSAQDGGGRRQRAVQGARVPNVPPPGLPLSTPAWKPGAGQRCTTASCTAAPLHRWLAGRDRRPCAGCGSLLPQQARAQPAFTQHTPCPAAHHPAHEDA